MRFIPALLVAVFFFTSCAPSEMAHDTGLPDLPNGAQGISLLGDTLFATSPNARAEEQLAAALADYEASPDDADAIIWYGRRTAYTGQYREAIRIYTEGIAKHPNDARM